MKKNDIIKQLIPGVIVGAVLGGVINTLAGVNTKEIMPNVINAMLASAIPTLLNGTIVLLGTSKILERKLSILKAFLNNLIYALIAAVLGFAFSFGLLHGLLNIDLKEITVLVNTIVLSILGIVVSTLLAYIALKRYEKSVKFTRRDAKKK